MSASQQQGTGAVLTALAALIALAATVLRVNLTAQAQTDVYAASALLIAIVFALFHISAGSAAAGLPTVDFRSAAFWTGGAATVLTALVVVFRLPLDPTQQHFVLAGVALVVNFILGAAKVSGAREQASARGGATPG